jgi:hypothetical protein
MPTPRSRFQRLGMPCRFLPNFTDGYKIVFVDNEDFLKELEQK